MAPAAFLPSGHPSLPDVTVDAVGWLDEATPGATRLRQPLHIQVVRSLTQEDLTEGHLVPAPPPSLREIKSSHHALAKLLASGRSHIEASAVTGYSPGYIGRLAGDAAFRELVLHYGEVEEIASADFLGQMRAVGMDLLNELRVRVEEDPKVLTTAQLYDGLKLLLVEPAKIEAARAGAQGGGGPGGIPPIQIAFVASATPQAGEVAEGKLIEGDSREIG